MPARTCSAIRAEVKRPRHSTAGQELRVRRVGLDDPVLQRRDELRHHEVPEEHLHQQRDVAEELDPGVADAHQPGARSSCASSPITEPMTRAMTQAQADTRERPAEPGDQQIRCTGSPPSGDLLEEDAPVPVEVHAVPPLPARLRAPSTRRGDRAGERGGPQLEKQKGRTRSPAFRPVDRCRPGSGDVDAASDALVVRVREGVLDRRRSPGSSCSCPSAGSVREPLGVDLVDLAGLHHAHRWSCRPAP